MKRWLILLPLIAGFVAGQDTPPAQPPPEATPPGAPMPAPEPASQGQPPPEQPPAAPVQQQPPSAPAGGDTSKAIPQAYSEEHYATTWSRNPFLIEVPLKGPEQVVGFADDWELRGLVRSNGEPMALLCNKKTQEFKRVKTTEDKDGFKLIKANIERDMHKSSVEVAKAGESKSATFTFPEVATAPGPAGANTRVPPMPVPPGGQGIGGIKGGVMPQQGGGVRPNGVPNMPNGVPVQPNMNGARVNPAIRTAPNAVPNPTQSRRRVLIPPQPSTTPAH